MEGKKRIVGAILDSIEKSVETGGCMSLEVLEANTGYSRFYLNRIFSEETGCTIHRYMKERKLTEAARKLVETDTAIVDISCEAGYQSQQAFTLAFRQAYGCAPMVYREKRLFHPLRLRDSGRRPKQCAHGRVQAGLRRCAA